ALDPHFLESGHDHDHHDHDHDDHDHHHHHEDRLDPGIVSVALRGGEVDPKKFMPWVQALTQEQGRNILRLKGILAFPDEPKRYVVQGVHMILEGDVARDWGAEEKRESRLVVIGRDLDRAALETGF